MLKEMNKVDMMDVNGGIVTAIVVNVVKAVTAYAVGKTIADQTDNNLAGVTAGATAGGAAGYGATALAGMPGPSGGYGGWGGARPDFYHIIK